MRAQHADWKAHKSRIDPEWASDRRKKRREKYRDDPDLRDQIRSNYIMALYNITPDEYNVLLADQNGVCAICSGVEDDRRLSIDHDHTSGYVRGLLCGACNRALGGFRDSADFLLNAVDYLMRTSIEGKLDADND
jgi:hypothetical protein